VPSRLNGADVAPSKGNEVSHRAAPGFSVSSARETPVTLNNNSKRSPRRACECSAADVTTVAIFKGTKRARPKTLGGLFLDHQSGGPSISHVEHDTIK
jgi:hypothetical protein